MKHWRYANVGRYLERDAAAAAAASACVYRRTKLALTRFELTRADGKSVLVVVIITNPIVILNRDRGSSLFNLE